MLYRGIYVQNIVFFHTKIVSKSKIACQMFFLQFKAAVWLCKGRRCKTAVVDMVAYGRSPMVAYARLWSSMVASGRLYSHISAGFHGGAASMNIQIFALAFLRNK